MAADTLSSPGDDAVGIAFIDTVWSIKRYDLGGFELNFDQPGRNASRFIELTMIGRGGRFIR